MHVNYLKEVLFRNQKGVNVLLLMPSFSCMSMRYLQMDPLGDCALTLRAPRVNENCAVDGQASADTAVILYELVNM